MASSTNSRNSRVQPVFRWLMHHAGDNWGYELVSICEGVPEDFELDFGKVLECSLEPEMRAEATPLRLAWMLRNAHQLIPEDGRRWRKLTERLADREMVEQAMLLLDKRTAHGLPRKARLEGKTYADVLIECEKTIIWVEGKRYDWLATSTKWDSSRDQLARNLEAACSLARAKDKDYCLVICHEYPLKHHEMALVKGYRECTWSAGMPHISMEQREEFSRRIFTTRWDNVALYWPELSELPELADLEQQAGTTPSQLIQALHEIAMQNQTRGDEIKLPEDASLDTAREQIPREDPADQKKK